MTIQVSPKLRRCWLACVAAIASAGLLCTCGSGDARTKSLSAIGHQWVNAWNEQRRDQLLSLLDDDVIFWWPTMKVPMRGKQEAGKYLESLWGGWSDIKLRKSGVLTNVETGSVAIDWVMTATDRKSGNSLELQGVDILQIRNGVITADRGIFNTCSFLAQLNAKPATQPSGGPSQESTPGVPPPP